MKKYLVKLNGVPAYQPHDRREDAEAFAKQLNDSRGYRCATVHEVLRSNARKSA